LTKTDTRPRVSEMIAFIKEHRDICGVELICRVLQIAPSPFYAHLAVARDRDLASDRAKRDAELRPQMKQVWEGNRPVSGARTSRQLKLRRQFMQT
jgi:putative transposase